jgi:hypothetical protein
MKNVMRFTIGIIALFMLMAGSFVLLAKHIYNRKDCVRFNIDNIETRTGIDVPATIDCKCNMEGMTKTSTFILDTSVTVLDAYIGRNGFEPGSDGYVKTGENEKTIWNASLNKETAELHFKIQYLD